MPGLTRICEGDPESILQKCLQKTWRRNGECCLGCIIEFINLWVEIRSNSPRMRSTLLCGTSREILLRISIQSSIFLMLLLLAWIRRFGSLGFLSKSGYLLGWQLKIDYGWQTDLRREFGLIVGLALFVGNRQSRHTFSFNAATQNGFGQWSKRCWGSTSFILQVARMCYSSEWWISMSSNTTRNALTVLVNWRIWNERARVFPKKAAPPRLEGSTYPCCFYQEWDEVLDHHGCQTFE
jgi:hypothetical protein